MRDRSLNDVIPMLQGSDEVIRLKLARLMSIPERDFNATMSRSSRYSLRYHLQTCLNKKLGWVIPPPCQDMKRDMMQPKHLLK